MRMRFSVHGSYVCNARLRLVKVNARYLHSNNRETKTNNENKTGSGTDRRLTLNWSRNRSLDANAILHQMYSICYFYFL